MRASPATVQNQSPRPFLASACQPNFANIMESLTVALDWTPNTNHTGFYVAQARGWYAVAGVDVTLLSPHDDGYKKTPASRLADGTADFACVPSESIVSHTTWPGGAKPRLVAVAALLQGSQSAIVTLASSGIDRPAKLDGKRYASYGARFEGRIVQAMIRADGGAGDFQELTPPMLGIWDTLVTGEADATWVFMPWEGVLAQQAGLQLHAFDPAAFGIPYGYGYSPVLAALPQTLTQRPAAVRAFLRETARGYEWAAAHPDEAAALLVEAVAAETADSPLPQPLEPGMVAASQRLVSAAYLHPSSQAWGVMDASVWAAFVDWLCETGLLTSKVQSRTAAGGGDSITVSLDALRAGDVGERLPREGVDVHGLFTNAWLPAAQ